MIGRVVMYLLHLRAWSWSACWGYMLLYNGLQSTAVLGTCRMITLTQKPRVLCHITPVLLLHNAYYLPRPP